MNPSIPPAVRASGAAYRMCPRCRQVLTQPSETHLHDSQCVKACRSSIAALHDVLNQKVIQYAQLKDSYDHRGEMLWETAHAAGGRLSIKQTPVPQNQIAYLNLENDEATQAIIVVATLEPISPKPN